MCGIWVSIGLKPDAGASRRALDAVAHRGPDGEGLRTFETPAGQLVLGHRRLSIYDPTPTGAQPMSYADDRYVVVFNGAIYNFHALRGELEQRGLAFTTRSDTEVLLAAYAAWGPDCVSRLNGMFAFVLWDQQARRLVIARDRFGEKPLHHARTGGGIAFASEIGQLLAVAPELARLDRRRAGDFLNFGVVDSSDQTFFAPIRRFPAAQVVTLDLASASALRDDLKPRRYWSPPAVDPALARPEHAAEALAPVFTRAVSLRLAADVPVGTCLSGGLDSTYIARTADQLREAAPPFVCVSAVFDADDLSGASLSERPYVEAALSGGNFAPHLIAPNDAAVAGAFDAIVRTQGEPFASASICVQYFVFAEARRAGVKVMLDGQGADELFAGYAGMIGPRLADLALGGDLVGWRREWNALGAPGGDIGLNELFRHTYSAALPESERRRLASLRGRWPPKSTLAPSLPPPPPSRDGPGQRLDGVIRRLVSTASLPGLLRYEDRNAMAHGVESRLPFLDADVADLALRMPGSAKIASGEMKRVLRLAAARVTPDLILRRRRKLGFVAPQDQWLSGALGGLARDALAAARSDWSDLIDPSALEGLDRQLGSNAAAGEKAFRVLSFVRWADMHGVSG
jgi:asparagine synthase (glutamine-hydrolysing)